MTKEFMCLIISACILLLAGCGNHTNRANDSANPADSQDRLEVRTEKWLDYSDGAIPWDTSIELELPEFPDVVFTWTPYGVTADDGREEKLLFEGMPIWNVYLCDLTGDGFRELCATVYYGSGIVDAHIVVYDFRSEASYTLWDRFLYDYQLKFEDGAIWVERLSCGEITTGNLVLATDEDTGEKFLRME